MSGQDRKSDGRKGLIGDDSAFVLAVGFVFSFAYFWVIRSFTKQ